MSPWTLLAGLVLAISLFGGGYYKGNQAGINAEKVRTQGIIDGYNLQIAEQKAAAASKAIDQRDQVIVLQAERDKFKKQLGEQHVKNQDLTNSLHDAYSAYSLRFRAEPENTGCGHGSGSCESTQGAGAGDAGATVVQLPDALTRDLRQLVKDADALNDDYKLCYGYVQEVVPVKRE
jgi:hypothetical protein